MVTLLIWRVTSAFSECSSFEETET
jgi:hypothetical protein